MAYNRLARMEQFKRPNRLLPISAQVKRVFLQLFMTNQEDLVFHITATANWLPRYYAVINGRHKGKKLPQHQYEAIKSVLYQEHA